jgi:branched-chain amino acid transport system substrate-binding protein
MVDRKRPSRRRVLKGVGAGGLAALAGCTSDGGGDGDGDAGSGDGGSGDGGSGGSGNGDGGGTATETPEQSLDVNVGVLASLSGPYSGLGAEMENGIEVANEHLEGGVWGDLDVNVELSIKDTELDPQVAIRRARELTNQEEIDLLIGPVSSSVAGGIQQHANENGLLHLHPISTAERWTNGDCGKYSFRATAHTYMNMKPVAEDALDTLGNTFATIGADYSWGRESVGAFVENAQSINSDSEVMVQAWPKLGTTDFSSAIQRVTDTDADFVVVRLTGSDIIRCIKQMDSFGVQDQMEIVSSNTHTLARGAGEAATGIIGGARYTHVLREEHTGNTQNKTFVEDFQSKTEQLPTTFAHGSYACLQSAALAMDQAGTKNSDELVGVLEGFEWEAPKGPMKYRECDHQAAQRMWGSTFVMDEELGMPVPEITGQHDLGTNNRPCEENDCTL